MSTVKPSVLVTGAGRGFGRAIADKFHEQGYTVVATDYDKKLLADLKGKRGYITAKHDVTKTADAAAVATLISKEIGHLDVIVNNAGVNAFYPLTEAAPEKTINAFMINTFGALIVSQACLDLLIASKGRVINISSESATFRVPFQFYQASKASLEALSDTMRRELQLFGVHVAIIRPGAIETEMTGELDTIVNDLKNSRYQKHFEKFAKMVAKNAPTKKMTVDYAAGEVYKAAVDPKKKTLYELKNSLSSKVSAMLPQELADKIIMMMTRAN
jgi:NAD(P)-dependent dehydrogenase (short-subunit alcohol dehydrogenase family)